MGTKILPIKIIDNCFPATVSDAVKVTNSKENIKQYTDREIAALKNYCDNDFASNIKKQLGASRLVNVVDDLGVIPNDQNEETRIANAQKIKDKILENSKNYNGQIVFYFPLGEYHINPIEIDVVNDTFSNNNESVGNNPLYVALLGESSQMNGYVQADSKNIAQIITYGNFILKTNTTNGDGASTMSIIAENLFIRQHDVNTILSTPPHGICFGATFNSGGEHNFYMRRCSIIGFEKGVYSPGYSCASTRFEECSISLCKYGILIMNAHHDLSIERCNINCCYRGITSMYGGNYCEIKNTHVDTSFHPSFQTFLDEDPRCYFLYTGGGLTLDGIYTEQYTGSMQGYLEIPSTYFLIDYEGNSYSSKGGKLLVRNVPCGSPGGYGKWFRGATFQGQGTLIIDGKPLSQTPYIRQPSSATLFRNGCVDFINCCPGEGNIKKYMQIYEGIDQAAGYVFDYRDLYGNGVGFTRHLIRGFKGAYIYDREGKNLIKHPTYGYGAIPAGYLVYEKNEIDPNVKTYKGNRIYKDIVPKGLAYEETGTYGCRIKGSVTIKNITNENADFTIFLYLNAKTSEMENQFIDLIDVNSSTLNKEFTTNFELTINAADYNLYSFGYRVNYNKSLTGDERRNDIRAKMPKGEDEAKIIYEYETEWNPYDVINRRGVDSISLSSETLNMTYGENTTEALSVIYKPTYTTQKGVEWTTSNKEIATVKDGTVTAVDAGECDIIATCIKNDYAHSARCKVTVTMPELQSISAVYTQGDSAVYPYTSLDDIKDNLEVTASYANGATRVVTNYSISGTLTVGTSTLTITYKEKTATINVNVSNAPTNDYVTDNLLVYVQAEDNCIRQQDESSTYVVDKYDGTHYSNTNLSTSMYNNTKKSITFAKDNTLKFDNDLVTVGGSYSIEVMARTESLVKQSLTLLLGNIHNDNAGYGSVFWCKKDNVLTASYRPSHTENQDLNYTFNTDDIWIYLTLVVDNTENKFKYYVNGNLVNSLDITKYANNSFPLSINTNDNANMHSNYDINAIRLYNKALSDSEVLSNYNYQQSLVQ